MKSQEAREIATQAAQAESRAHKLELAAARRDETAAEKALRECVKTCLSASCHVELRMFCVMVLPDCGVTQPGCGDLMERAICQALPKTKHMPVPLHSLHTLCLPSLAGARKSIATAWAS